MGGVVQAKFPWVAGDLRPRPTAHTNVVALSAMAILASAYDVGPVVPAAYQ